MAAPVDSARQGTNITTAGTSHAINVGSPVAGTLLIVFVRFAAAPGTVTFTGYTQMASDTSDATDDTTNVYYRWADGSEGATDTLTTTNSVKLAAISWEVTGAENPSISPPMISVPVIGTTTANTANSGVAVSDPTGPFPATSTLLDDFNRANEGPPPSASWLEWLGNGISVLSNQASPGNLSGADNGAFWNAAIDWNMEVYMDLATVQGNTFCAVLARANRTGTAFSGTYYDFGYSHDGPTAKIELFDGSTGFNLSGDQSLAALSNGDAIGLRAYGCRLQGYVRRNGTWEKVATVPFHTQLTAAANTKAAIYSFVGGATSAKFDNFRAAAYTGPSVDTLYISMCAGDGEVGAYTGVPTNYANLIAANSGTGGAAASNCLIGGASRQITASVSEDPGVFTHAAHTTGWTGFTVAIKAPAPVGGPPGRISNKSQLAQLLRRA